MIPPDIADIIESAREEGRQQERERIAAALPEALATALLRVGEDLDIPPNAMADAILAHPAVRAVLAPEGE